MDVGELVRHIEATATLPEQERVDFYNALQRALGRAVLDISPDPACAPQLVPVDCVVGNAYNPNRVASVEMDLLETSIRADGITMAIVVMPDPGWCSWEVVDGFHRHLVASQRLGRRYLPCSVIDRPLADRMASTVRHNRARGKHHVDLMADLVKGMLGLGWDDQRIASALGMSEEELLRLKQTVGVARWMAAERYNEFYGRDDEPPLPPEDEP